MGLSNTLHKQHQFLLDELEHINHLGIGEATAKARLMTIKDVLLAHLHLEDEKLYPPLQIAALTHPSIKRTLEAFATEMEVVTTLALAFFAKYEHADNWQDFPKDYGHLCGKLKIRIQREENFLYPLFDALEEQ
jgi:hypothetical protein